MKRLTCEMCGGTDLVKQDGVFECQACGCKYSVEEAKKMMVEGTVDVSGSTVKVDSSDRLKNLYQIARRAKDDNNGENAAKYYDMILVEDPTSWEAAFYVVYFRATECKIAQIQSAASSVYNCIDSVFKLIQDHVPGHEEQVKAYSEVAARVLLISSMLYNGAKNHFDGIDPEIKDRFSQEFLNNVLDILVACYSLAESLCTFFGNDHEAQKLAVSAWKQGIEYHKSVVWRLRDKETNINMIESYANKIRKYEPSYQTPEICTKGGGCYVATCVYGSYDCPQVWTLRRYRDYTLAKNRYGRAFICTYYAISPTLVKWFGNAEWFKNMWKPKLDNMVSRLNSNGVEDTPYQDQCW